MMNQIPTNGDLHQLCDRLEACIGRETYHRLLGSVGATLKRGRLVFWQEELLRKFAAETGVVISTIPELAQFSEVAIAKIRSETQLPKAITHAWHFYSDTPSEPPAGFTQKEWARQMQELRDWAEKEELAADGIMRQANDWRSEAIRIANESKTVRNDGNSVLAQEKSRLAFDYARRAADHCRNVWEENEFVSSCHRIAAEFANECGEFQEAVRLAWGMSRGRILGDNDTVRKRMDEIGETVRAIEEQAEVVRQRLIGTRLKEITFPTGCAAFSHNSQFLACVAGDNQIQVYDLIDNQIAFEFDITFKTEPLADQICSRRRIAGIDFASNGKLMAVAGDEGSIFIWDCIARKTIHMLSGHAYNTYAVAFSPNSQRLASSGCFGMKLWDPVTGKKRGSFANTVHNHCVAFSPDSKWVAWGRSDGGRLTVLDVETKKEIYSVRAHSDIVRDLAFSPCGQMLASASGNGTVKLIEADNGREIVTLNGGNSSHVNQASSLAFSPDGALLATAMGSHILIWSLPNFECIFAIPDTYPTNRVRFSPNGRFLAAVGKSLRLWQVDHLLGLEKDLSSLKGTMGSISVPKNPQTAFEQAVKATPVPAKMAPPDHLRNCIVPLKSRCSRKSFVGNLQCPCGNTIFHLLHAGEICDNAQGEQFPRETSSNDGGFFVIKATCSSCSTEHLVFDRDFHGWNGFVCRTDAHLRPRPTLVPWRCVSCNHQEHTAEISILSEGRRDAIAESSEFLNDSNWQEGFSAIKIATKCCNCSHKNGEWVLWETM